MCCIFIALTDKYVRNYIILGKAERDTEIYSITHKLSWHKYFRKVNIYMFTCRILSLFISQKKKKKNKSLYLFKCVVIYLKKKASTVFFTHYFILRFLLRTRKENRKIRVRVIAFYLFNEYIMHIHTHTLTPTTGMFHSTQLSLATTTDERILRFSSKQMSGNGNVSRRSFLFMRKNIFHAVSLGNRSP